MCVKCVNVKIFMRVDEEALTYDLDGSNRRNRIQQRWDANKQRKRLNNALNSSGKNKIRKM